MPETSQKKAVVVLSGGLDSTTCLYIARSQGYALYALSFNYGQRHTKELVCADIVGQEAGVVNHRFIQLPTPTGSALTTSEPIPEERSLEQMASVIPSTYVPARNTLFIAYALQYAEEIDADAIFIGVTAMDYSGYPDCRPEYIEAWQKLIHLATKKTVTGGRITLVTPVLQMYKAEIVDWGTELGVPYQHTWSCYKGGEKSCGVCDSCKLRLKGFREADKRDPLEYEVDTYR